MTVGTGAIKTSRDVPNLVYEKCQMTVNIQTSHVLQAPCYGYR